MKQAVFLGATLMGVVVVASEADALGKTQTCSFPATADPAPSTRSDAIEGAIPVDAPVMNGRLWVPEEGSSPPRPSCAAPDSSPELTDASEHFRYRAHAFKNYKPVESCVSITVYRAPSSGPLQVAAYLGSFQPEDPRENYLGAEHAADLDVYHFSVEVPAHSPFVVVLNGERDRSESTAAIFYTLIVGGCGAPADANAPKGAGTDWPLVVAASSSSPRPTGAISTVPRAAPPETSPRGDGCNAAGTGAGSGAWLLAVAASFAVRRRSIMGS